MTIPSVASAAAVSPTAPNPPTNVSTSDLGALRRTTWTDNASNEDNQHIQRRSRVAGTSMWGAWVTLDAAIAPNVTTSDDGTGGSGFEYQYQVRAENAAGVSPWAIGNVVCVAQAPGTPTGLNATAVLFSDSEIDLTWNAPSGTVQTYGIWRDGQFLQEVTGTTFRDSGLAAGTEYCYNVDARNACLPPSSQSVQVCETTNIVAPSTAPDVTRFEAISASQFEVEWSAVARAEYHEIQTDEDPLFGSPDPIETSPGTDLEETIGGYPDDTQQYVRVRAGNTAGVGPWSTTVISATTWPALPKNVSVQQDTGACPSRVYTVSASAGSRPNPLYDLRRNNGSWESVATNAQVPYRDELASIATSAYEIRFAGEAGTEVVVNVFDQCLL